MKAKDVILLLYREQRVLYVQMDPSGTGVATRLPVRRGTEPAGGLASERSDC